MINLSCGRGLPESAVMENEIIAETCSGTLPLLAAAALFFCLVLIYRMGRQRDKLFQERNALFDFVHDVSEAFVKSDETHVDFLLKRVLFYAQRTSMAGAGAIYFAEPNKTEFKARAVSGLFPPIISGFDDGLDATESKFRYAHELVRKQLALRGVGLVGEAAETGTPILIEDAERDPRVPRFKSEMFQIRSILLAPMRFQNTVMGVLVVINRIDDEPFIQSDLSLLQALADQASVTIYFAKFSEELAEKKLLDHDLEVAQRIQGALMPSLIPEIEGLDLAAFSIPARQVGGDYYDFEVIDDNHFGMAVADVSGKGVTGAIVMSICRSVFRAQAATALSPAKVLKAINKVITKDAYEDMFISMLYAVINVKTFEMKIARAGHPQPLIISSDGQTMDKINSGGIAMGLTETDVFNTALEERVITLKPGDIFVAYTDGLLELKNKHREEWTLQQLQGAILANADHRAGRIVESVRRELKTFVEDTAQYDDMTLVVMSRKKEDQQNL